MIYDEVGEVVRRYGKTGWKVVVDNECLKELFRREGDWRLYGDGPQNALGLDDCCGGNVISWEMHGDLVYLEHDYCGAKAKVMRDTMLAIIRSLREWRSA